MAQNDPQFAWIIVFQATTVFQHLGETGPYAPLGQSVGMGRCLVNILATVISRVSYQVGKSFYFE